MAYRLDGPNGLPTEGKWYASKVSRNWGGAGLRDFIISFGGGTPEHGRRHDHRRRQSLAALAGTPPDKPLTFIGVDAQYFSAVLMPQRDESGRRLVRRVAADPRRQGRSAAHEPDEHVVPADRHACKS